VPIDCGNINGQTRCIVPFYLNRQRIRRTFERDVGSEFHFFSERSG
jgi:hypothetical protein